MAPWLGRRMGSGRGDGEARWIVCVGSGMAQRPLQADLLSSQARLKRMITSPMQAASAPALCTQKMYHGIRRTRLRFCTIRAISDSLGTCDRFHKSSHKACAMFLFC